jgi:predicted enzyme involved in methoxymalonyl-ACP biosynthesis
MQEIFSSWSHKTEHFQRIHRSTGEPFTSMLFFDDENRNIEAVKLPLAYPFSFENCLQRHRL